MAYIFPEGELIQISSQKFLTRASLYGLGVTKAILVDKTNRDFITQYSPDVTGYDPDARYDPDQKSYIKSDRWDGSMSTSLSGMPVMCYFKFIGNTYKDLKGQDVVIPDIKFETCILSVTMGKNIKMEEISGRDTGSVKEYIGMKDWIIELRVIVTSDAPLNSEIERRNQEGVYPRDNMEDLIKVLRASISPQIDCWFLQQFGINNVTIEDGVRIDQTEGEYSSQVLVIPMRSDNPLIIRVLN